MKIEYHPAVADELEEIRDHYEESLPGLEKLSSMSLSVSC